MEWQTVTGILGLIVLLGNVGAVIGKWLHPIIKKSKKIDELEERTSRVEQCLHRDNEELKEIKGMVLDIDRMLLALLNHSIDGNGIEKMKILRNKVIDNMTGVSEHE